MVFSWMMCMNIHNIIANSGDETVIFTANTVQFPNLALNYLNSSITSWGMDPDRVWDMLQDELIHLNQKANTNPLYQFKFDIIQQGDKTNLVMYRTKHEKATSNLSFVQKVTIDNIPKAYIDKSSIHGFGLFAKEPINSGETIAILDGQVMKYDDYKRIEEIYIGSEIIKGAEEYFFMEWNMIRLGLLRVRPMRTKYSYINHSRQPNLFLMNNSQKIIALNDIDAGQELLLDYCKEPLTDEYLSDPRNRYLLEA